MNKGEIWKGGGLVGFGEKRKEDEELSNQNSLDTGMKCQSMKFINKKDMYNINDTYSWQSYKLI